MKTFPITQAHLQKSRTLTNNYEQELALKTVEQVFAYFEQFINLERSPSKREYKLQRMHKLVAAFGNPQHEYQCIHIAGSKGKGSTATMLATILDGQDKRIGLFTSPHLLSYRERIRVLDTKDPIPEEELDQIIIAEGNEIYRHVETNYRYNVELPTLFELITLLAFCVFRRVGCNWAVIETGLGGRLDATNVLLPALSIITRLELEHCNFLGYDIQSIASEKAGIIKAGSPVLYAPQDDNSKRIIQNKARATESPCYLVSDHIRYSNCRVTAEGTFCTLHVDDGLHKTAALDDVKISLIGEHQCQNASLALMAASILMPWIPFARLTKGLEKTNIRGRFDIVSQDPPVIYDSAHTPRSIECLLETFTKIFPADGTLVFASAQDKQHEQIIPLLAERFSSVIVTQPNITNRFRNPRKLCSIFERYNRNPVFIEDSVEALTYAIRENPQGPILVTGSSYLIAEVMHAPLPCH